MVAIYNLNELSNYKLWSINWAGKYKIKFRSNLINPILLQSDHPFLLLLLTPLIDFIFKNFKFLPFVSPSYFLKILNTLLQAGYSHFRSRPYNRS